MLTIHNQWGDIGIICIKFSEMANITSPVGLTLFDTRNAAPEVPIETIVRGADPFLLWIGDHRPILCFPHDSNILAKYYVN